MNPIYLQHERHGTKVAIAEAEAVADEKNGWKRFNPVAPSPNPIAAQTPEPARNRGGRPRKAA